MEQILSVAKEVAAKLSDESGDGFLVVGGNPLQSGFPGEAFGCVSDKWKPEDFVACIGHLVREVATALDLPPGDLAQRVGAHLK